MNASTYKAVRAILATDQTISPDRQAAALAVLSGRGPKQEPLPLVLTQKQAAHLLGVSRFTIRNMTRDGQLHPVSVHKCRRYKRGEIEAVAAKGV